ncbi:MAG: ATP-binding protein [Tabrizicola sp.]
MIETQGDSAARSLGLSIARQFAEHSGGTLVRVRRPEGGTKARLEFDC